MRTIPVKASVSYDVLIGKGLLKNAGHIISALGNIKRAIVVSDDLVYSLYGEQIEKELVQEGIDTNHFVFEHGEQSKCIGVYESLLEFLCEKHLTRSDILIALGGGVTGDLTGFAAATYQRGIRFVQIPTSLLAAVDSSVGGKTAVNLANGKNQVGCFYQPSVVICDIDTLKTLPESEFRNGMAEVIKYGMIEGSINPDKPLSFFEKLENNPIEDWLEDAIASCVELKRDVVNRDEFDTGDRMYLNLGHTFAHGVEKLSGYTTPHGTAVAMGMAVITRRAEEMELCDKGTSARLDALLKRYGLPTVITDLPEEIAAVALADKKSLGDKLRLIVPKKIGICEIVTIKSDEVEHWLV